MATNERFKGTKQEKKAAQERKEEEEEEKEEDEERTKSRQMASYVCKLLGKC